MHVLAEKAEPIRVLAIETTGPWCSVALLRGRRCGMQSLGYEEPVELVSREKMSHLQALLPMAEQLLAETGVKKSQLTHIAVSQGPGSFTGIRIGVATARALGQALDIPVVGVPTLNSFFAKPQVSQVMEGGVLQMTDGGAWPVICGILNARRGQVYGAVQGYLSGCPCMLTDVLAVIGEQVKADGHKVLFYGDGIDAYETRIVEALAAADMVLGRDYAFAPIEMRYQNAAAVAITAVGPIVAGKTVACDDLHPDYMRKTEAEQKLQAGELPICKLPKQE